MVGRFQPVSAFETMVANLKMRNPGLISNTRRPHKAAAVALPVEWVGRLLPPRSLQYERTNTRRIRSAVHRLHDCTDDCAGSLDLALADLLEDIRLGS
jgi:hypothetical protein